MCVLPDTGERYLSKVYNDEWLKENRLLEPERLLARDVVLRKNGDAPQLVSVAPQTTAREALDLMNRYNISQLPVFEDDNCVGAVSEGTLMARVIECPTVIDEPVGNVMDAPFPMVEGSTPLAALGRQLARQNSAVLVCEGGRISGIVTRYDLVRYLAQ